MIISDRPIEIDNKAGRRTLNPDESSLVPKYITADGSNNPTKIITRAFVRLSI